MVLVPEYLPARNLETLAARAAVVYDPDLHAERDRLLSAVTEASAVLDVFSVEPLGPEAAAVFEGLDNLVLTPHLAGNATEAVDRIASSTVGAVLERLASG